MAIALCISLLMIIIQDFHHRAVSIIWLTLTLVLQILIVITQISVKEFLAFWGINLLILAIQLGMLYFFFGIKNRKFTTLIDQSIGKGDIFFFVVVTAAFSPINFILFYITALSITLFISLLFYRKKLIPLAGWLAILYLPVVVLNLIPVNLHSYIDIIKL